MQKSAFCLLTLFLAISSAFCQSAPAADANSPTREWTSTDGKKITATYLGVQNANVALKLANGKVTFVPTTRFSAEDNAYIGANLFDYRTEWQAWPPESRAAMPLVSVTEEKNAADTKGGFIYKTPHFRFVSNVDLGTALMKDLARVFELTYQLQKISPLGTLAEPAHNGLFDAKLFGGTASYHAAGGPERTAGVYLIKEKVFLAPLSLMGVQKGSAGWRKDSDSYDLSTIVHELTHMLTHGMLDNLPTWVNEGYAEYIACIPRERNAFVTTDERIRDGVIDALISYSDSIKSNKGVRTGNRSKAEHIQFTNKEYGPDLPKVETVLTMNDVTWADQPKATKSGSITTIIGSEPVDPLRLPRLYRTAHLIIYYFIQIEGEKGVGKIRRFLEENQKIMGRYEKYVADFKNYESQMAEFMKLPGVVKLDDNRFKFPSNLTPPKSPEAPFKDPDELKLGGIQSLLEGETAGVVGARIEAALIEDLGVKFQFQ